jgi:hypothetical protein
VNDKPQYRRLSRTADGGRPVTVNVRFRSAKRRRHNDVARLSPGQSRRAIECSSRLAELTRTSPLEGIRAGAMKC